MLKYIKMFPCHSGIIVLICMPLSNEIQMIYINMWFCKCVFLIKGVLTEKGPHKGIKCPNISNVPLSRSIIVSSFMISSKMHDWFAMLIPYQGHTTWIVFQGNVSCIWLGRQEMHSWKAGIHIPKVSLSLMDLLVFSNQGWLIFQKVLDWRILVTKQDKFQ